jgi:hypothetical protein
MENDYYKRISFNFIDSSPGFATIKRYIQSNFDRLNLDNYFSQGMLNFYNQLYFRNRAISVFTNEQASILLESNFNNLVNNHTKMSTNTLLNQISCLMIHKNIPDMIEILKSRQEEISTISFPALNKLIRRALNDRISEFTRENFVRFLANDYLNLATGEKMINKCRAFNSLTKLNSITPFSIVGHLKLANLLKDIRAQSENHDQQSILLVVEGLNSYDDPLKNEALKETCEIVIMTIKHLEENVKLDFVLKFIENITVSPNNILSNEQLTTLFKYVNTQLNQITTSQGRAPYISSLISTFSLMKKVKFFDTETVTTILSLVEANLFRLSQREELKDVKFVVSKVLGEERVTSIENKIIDRYIDEKEKLASTNINYLMSVINKASKFGNINLEKTKQFVNELTDYFVERIKTDTRPPIIVLIRYLEFQEYLSNDLRVKFVTVILNKFTEEYIKEFRYPDKLVFYLNLLIVKAENEILKADLIKKLDLAASDPRFKTNFTKSLQRITKDEINFLNNFSIFKMSNYLREFSKSPEFLAEPRIFNKLIISVVNLIFNLSKSNYNLEAVISLLNSVEAAYFKANSPAIEISRNKLPQMIKLFERAHVNTSIFKKTIIQFLDISRDHEKNYMTVETIMMIEKILKNDTEEEDVMRILNKFFPNKQKVDSYFNECNNMKAKLNFIKLLILINKKAPTVITDEQINAFKNYLWNDVVKGEYPEYVKLDALCVMTTLKTAIYKYNNDKENNNIIRNIVTAVPLKKALRSFEVLPGNSYNKLIRRLMIEFSSLYEKDTSIDKFLLLRIVDKFTIMNWNMPNFFNKVILDYEKNFDSFTNIDHQTIVSYFARVEFNKEDVISAAVKNINLRFINDNLRFDLFNNLVSLGFTNQEWKETCLEKILINLDLNQCMMRSNFRDKITYMNNLWKLGNWPANINELVYIFNSGCLCQREH